MISAIGKAHIQKNSSIPNQVGAVAAVKSMNAYIPEPAPKAYKINVVRGVINVSTDARIVAAI